MHISDYINDGFARVCTVSHEYSNHKQCDHWLYSDIDESMMYSAHVSWVYFIVSAGEIVKVGETGMPLGIRIRNSDQPTTGTKSRFGRLRCFTANGVREDTDSTIRNKLSNDVRDGKVAIWARKCPINLVDMVVAGATIQIEAACHKVLEKKYLASMIESDGCLPWLNPGKA